MDCVWQQFSTGYLMGNIDMKRTMGISKYNHDRICTGTRKATIRSSQDAERRLHNAPKIDSCVSDSFRIILRECDRKLVRRNLHFRNLLLHRIFEIPHFLICTQDPFYQDAHLAGMFPVYSFCSGFAAASQHQLALEVYDRTLL